MAVLAATDAAALRKQNIIRSSATLRTPSLRSDSVGFLVMGPSCIAAKGDGAASGTIPFHRRLGFPSDERQHHTGETAVPPKRVACKKDVLHECHHLHGFEASHGGTQNARKPHSHSSSWIEPPRGLVDIRLTGVVTNLVDGLQFNPYVVYSRQSNLKIICEGTRAKVVEVTVVSAKS